MPAAAAATETQTNNAELAQAAKIRQQMADSLGIKLDPEVVAKDGEAAAEGTEKTDDLPPVSARTLGELAAEQAAKKKETNDDTGATGSDDTKVQGAATSGDTADVGAAAGKVDGASDPGSKIGDQKAEEPAAKVEVGRSSADELKQKLAQLQTAQRPEGGGQKSDTESQKAESQRSEEGAQSEEAAYIAGLTEEQQYELEVARYAEGQKNGPEGAHTKLLASFKAFDKWAAEHQDADPEGEEFQAFAKKTRYQVPNRLKYQRLMVEEGASRRAEAAAAARIEEQQRRLRALEVRPVIAEAVQNFKELLAKPEQLGLKPEEAGIGAEVFAEIQKNGLEAAAKKFDVEVPIYKSMAEASQAYLDYTHGAVEFDPNNRMHRWLDQFINDQEQVYRSKPETERKIGGKTFVTREEFAKAHVADANKARRELFTLDDASILEMLGTQAHVLAKQEKDRRVAAGWSRTTAADGQRTEGRGQKSEGEKDAKAHKNGKVENAANASARKEPDPVSPRGGSTAAPGATASETKPVHPMAGMMSGLGLKI